MQIIEKNEREMNKEEKLLLEIMRTLAAGKCRFISDTNKEKGSSQKTVSLRDRSIDFNFTKNSSAYYMAQGLLERFNVSFKDNEAEKIFWPEHELKWKGKNLDGISSENLNGPEIEKLKIKKNEEVNPVLDDIVKKKTEVFKKLEKIAEDEKNNSEKTEEKDFFDDSDFEEKEISLENKTANKVKKKKQ